MSYISCYRKRIKDKIQTLGQTLGHTYTDFLANVSSETTTHWTNAKAAYEAWLEKGEGFRHSQLDAKLFRFGNKAGRLLANFTKGIR